MDIEISKIEMIDVPRIYELYCEFAEYEELQDYFTATSEDIKKAVFEDKNLYIYKIMKDDKIIAFTSFYYQIVTFPMKKVLYLEDIYVSPEFRGQGIGTRIFETLEEIAIKENCIKIKWECLQSDPKAQHFYEEVIKGHRDSKWLTYDKMV